MAEQQEKTAPPADETAAQAAQPAEAPAGRETASPAPEGEKKSPPKAEPAPVPSRPAPPVPPGQHYFWGTGRRKKAVARVRIRPGTGKFLINKRDANEYFPLQRDREDILAPLEVSKMVGSWDIWANVRGGGYTGQAGAVKLGLARAIARAVPEVEADLRDHGLLTRDARMSERKKPGQPGARKRFQFSKR